MPAPRKPYRRRRRDPAAAARLLPRIPPAGMRMGVSDLGAAWHQLGPRAVGALPVRLSRNGVVTVACADAMRAHQVRSDAEFLQAELSRIAGISITRIDTVIADHALEMPTFDAPEPPPVTPAAQAAAEQVAQGMTAEIEDPDLREVIARAAAAWIARRWDQRGTDHQ